MCNIVSKNTVYLGLNIVCAAANIYYSPITFSLGFAVGAAVGLGMGLQRRARLLIIDYNERAVNATTSKVNSMTESLQTKAGDGLSALGETRVGKITTDLADKAKPTVEVAQKIANPIIKLYLYFSGHGAVISQIGSYLWGFKEQSASIMAKMNPIPGYKGTCIALCGMAANVGYITWPIFSKLWILSGFPVGYGAGLYVMNADWRLLRTSQPAVA